MDETINQYINEAKNSGIGGDQIKRNLLAAGWSEEVIKKFEAQIMDTSHTTPEQATTSNGAVLQTPPTQTEKSSSAESSKTAVVPAEVKTIPNTEIKIDPPKQSSPWFKQTKFIILGVVSIFVLVLLIAGLLAYRAYGQGKTVFGYNIQDDFWKQLINTEFNSSVDNTLNFSYKDKGTFGFTPSKFITEFSKDTPVETEAKQLQSYFPEWDQKYSFTLNNPAIKLETKGYYNLTDNKDKQAIDAQGSFSVDNNATTYELDGAIKATKVFAFLKFNYSDSIEKSINRAFDNMDFDWSGVHTYKDKWLKFSQTDIEKQTTSLPTDQQYLDKTKAIWLQNRFFSISGFKGVTKLNNEWNLHYQISLDKSKLKTGIIESIKADKNSDWWDKDAEKRTIVERALDTWLGSFEVKNAEIWVGFDKQVHKFDITFNVISVTDTANMLYKETTSGVIKDGVLASISSNSSDTKRVEDVMAIKSALENYKKDFGGFPGATNGVPNLGSNYIYVVPTAPVPPEGRCTSFYNNYWYTPVGTPTQSLKNGSTVYPDYTFSFCLGQMQSGFGEGVNILTPNGNKTFTCPGGKICYADIPPTKPNQYAGKSDSDILNDVTEKLTQKFFNLPKTAELNFSFTNTNIGKEKTVVPPTDFLDLSKK